MKAYVIDPAARTITEVDYDSSDYRNIYKLIDCECFTVAPVGKSDDEVYVDDEGLLKLSEGPTPAFQFLGGHQALVGKGLVVGPPDDEGRNTPATLTLEKLKNITYFGYI